MNSKAVFAGLVAMIMVTCVVPFMASDDSDALIGNTPDMSLNTNGAVIYANSNPNSVVLVISTLPAGADASDARWERNNIGDGINFVSLSANPDGSVTVIAGSIGSAYVKSVEVVATIGSSHASAVIVVYQSPSATATVFHYYVKIDQSAIPSGVTPQTTGFTDNHTINDFYNGFWIEVQQSQYNGTDSWSAMSAFQWYCDTYGWNCSASGGWINTILNLGTYPGPNGVWYYWAQYHANGNSWAFNNTVMSYITSVDSSYIGLIFWGSPDANTMPAFPGYPQPSA